MIVKDPRQGIQWTEVVFDSQKNAVHLQRKNIQNAVKNNPLDILQSIFKAPAGKKPSFRDIWLLQVDLLLINFKPQIPTWRLAVFLQLTLPTSDPEG